MKRMSLNVGMSQIFAHLRHPNGNPFFRQGYLQMLKELQQVCDVWRLRTRGKSKPHLHKSIAFRYNRIYTPKVTAQFLKDISILVRAGEIHGIVGNAGSVLLLNSANLARELTDK